jgi:hypothetical protein
MVRTGYSNSSAASCRSTAASTTASNIASTGRPSRCRSVVVSESGCVSERTLNNNSSVYSVVDPGLLDRTAYTNASVALHHIEKVENVDGIQSRGWGGLPSPPSPALIETLSQVGNRRAGTPGLSRRAGTCLG